VTTVAQLACDSTKKTTVTLRLLIDSGDYTFYNLGDAAMFQISMERLFQVFSGSTFHVFTQAPDKLKRMYPTAVPLDCAGRAAWSNDDVFLGKFARKLPQLIAGRARLALRLQRRLTPGVFQRVLDLRLFREAAARRNVREYISAVRNCDAYVVTGAGGMTDHAQGWARWVLDTAELALHFSKPVIMLSQGIGPVETPILREQLARTVPRFRLVALREGRFGNEFLKELAVDRKKVMVTGDDAIELASRQEATLNANGIGLSLRCSRSSRIQEQTAVRVAARVVKFIRGTDLELVGLPVEPASDGPLLARTVGSAGATCRLSPVSSPAELIAQVSGCRVVITAAYHAAVFALSQGLPVICLEQSPYFRQKFEGLLHEFGAGSIISLESSDWEERLGVELASALSTGGQVRDRLRQAASRQIQAGRSMYSKLPEIVRSSAAMPVSVSA